MSASVSPLGTPHMRMLTIEVTPELEQRLQEEAAKSGQSVAEVAFAILQERLVPPAGGAGAPEEVHALSEGLPRRTSADLRELAEAQGVKPVERFEDLLGDFWPEDDGRGPGDAAARGGRVPPGGARRCLFSPVGG